MTCIKLCIAVALPASGCFVRLGEPWELSPAVPHMNFSLFAQNVRIRCEIVEGLASLAHAGLIDTITSWMRAGERDYQQTLEVSRTAKEMLFNAVLFMPSLSR
jgi:hypothetical protein